MSSNLYLDYLFYFKFLSIPAYTYSWIPGFRVISFPSPLCLTYNFWLWMDWSDPGNMLTWLVDQLLLAEAAGEKVHILSHVPPGRDSIFKCKY